MGDDEPSEGGRGKLRALRDRLAPLPGLIWKELSSPAGLAIVGFVCTGLLGSWFADRLKYVDAARDAATQERKDRTDRINKIESLLGTSLQNRMTYVKLISDELDQDDDLNDLNKDWSTYRQLYVDGTASILLGDLSMQKELRDVDPRALRIFHKYLLSYVEPKLEDEDYCLSAARSAYVGAPATPGERAKRAKMQLSTCGSPDIDKLSTCVTDIIINIHDAVTLNDAQQNATNCLEGGVDCNKDAFGTHLGSALLKDCGPPPPDGS